MLYYFENFADLCPETIFFNWSNILKSIIICWHFPYFREYFTNSPSQIQSNIPTQKVNSYHALKFKHSCQNFALNQTWWVYTISLILWCLDGTWGLNQGSPFPPVLCLFTSCLHTNPTSFCSASIDRCHVILCLPLLRCPCGVHLGATLARLLFGILRTWPAILTFFSWHTQKLVPCYSSQEDLCL